MIAVLLLVIPVAAAAEPEVVYLQGSANPTFNLRFTELLEAELGEDTQVRSYASLRNFEGPPGPVITLGPDALTQVLEHGTKRPVLALLIGVSEFQGFSRDSDADLSAVFYDVPLLRQALIGRVILPQATRMALLARPDQADQYDDLIDRLPGFGIEARIFLVTSEDTLIPNLSRALEYGDFLLATPDDTIYNARTIKHILLTTYRRNRLVIGPSHAFVRAGVLASSYVPLPEYARVAAGYIKKWQKTGELPAPSYPDVFSIEVNRQVARSLNIPLPADSEIVDEVQGLLQKPEEEGE
ncbi:MAG: ABC transporter substrate-binding protein [Marinobacter sp.]